MFKRYTDRDISSVTPISVVSSVPQKQKEMDSEEINVIISDPASSKLEFWHSQGSRPETFTPRPSRRKGIETVNSWKWTLIPDIPTRTDKIYHDVNVEDSQPVKQHPYRMNPPKKYLKEEIQYLLDNDFIEPCKSEWSSPCILVPKPDGSHRMCTDYRKVYNLSKTDTFPIPRIDDCIDKIGNSKIITKFDLLKEFRQISLTERAKKISTFVTPYKHIVCTNIMAHLDEHKLLSDRQHAFRKNRSCETQLITVINDWAKIWMQEVK